MRQIILLLTLVLLAACSLPLPAATGDNGGVAPVLPPDGAGGDPLAGSRWRLVEIDGRPAPEGTVVSLSFANGNAGGSVCNHYGGSYTILGADGIEIRDVAQTEMFCMEPEGLMELEQEYVSLLIAVNRFQIDGERLTLESPDGRTLLYDAVPVANMDPVRLQSTVWRLAGMDGAPVPSYRLATLAFAGERVSGFAGCRFYEGSYEAEGDQLTIPSLGMTSIHCIVPEVMQRFESDFTSLLSESRSYVLANDSLTVTTSRGREGRFVPYDSEARPEPLLWLTAIVQADAVRPVPPASGISLWLTDERISGSAGCNQYSGSVMFGDEATVDGLIPLTLGPLAMTKMACDEERMAMETELAALLADVIGYRVEENDLILETRDGTLLQFQGGR